MRAEEIRELSEDEVRSRIAELEEERFRLRFRSATEALEDPLRFRIMRKDIARLKTILRERELAAARGAAAGHSAPEAGATRARRSAGARRSGAGSGKE